MNYLEILIEYIVVFISILIINYFLFIKKNKKYNKNKTSMEVVYLCSLYKINMKKVNYKGLVYSYSIVNSFIISTVYIICTYLIKGLLLQFLVGLVLLGLLIIICYEFLGRYYNKKSNIKSKVK